MNSYVKTSFCPSVGIIAFLGSLITVKYDEILFLASSMLLDGLAMFLSLWLLIYPLVSTAIISPLSNATEILIRSGYIIVSFCK